MLNIYLIAPRIPPGRAGIRDKKIVASVLQSLGDPVMSTCHWSCFGCHLRPLGEPWRSFWIVEGMTGDVNMSTVTFWGSLGRLWVVLEMAWGLRGSLGVACGVAARPQSSQAKSLGRLGEVLGGPWVCLGLPGGGPGPVLGSKGASPGGPVALRRCLGSAI